MKQNSVADAPPLRIWKYTLLLTLFVLAGLFFMMVREETLRDESFLRRCGKRINAFQSDMPGERVEPVVIIGSSLLARCARSRNFDSQAENAGLTDLRFLHLSRPGGNIYHFLPLIEALGSLSPSLLLIQSDLLFDIKYTSPFSLNFLLNLPGYITSKIRTHTRIRKRDFLCNHFPGKYLKWKIKVMKNRMARPTVEARVIRDLLEELRQRRIKAIIFDIPRSAPLEIVKNSLRSEKHGDFMRFCMEEQGVSWLFFPRYLDPSLFRDYAHFRTADSGGFLKWLMTKIQPMLQNKVMP